MKNNIAKVVEAVDLYGLNVLEEGIVPAYSSVTCQDGGGGPGPTEPPTDTLPG